MRLWVRLQIRTSPGGQVTAAAIPLEQVIRSQGVEFGNEIHHW